MTLAGGGAEQAEGALDERAFAAAVLAEQAEDRAGFDGEVDAARGPLCAGGNVLRRLSTWRTGWFIVVIPVGKWGGVRVRRAGRRGRCGFVRG